jgi:hypothetical protein
MISLSAPSSSNGTIPTRAAGMQQNSFMHSRAFAWAEPQIVGETCGLVRGETTDHIAQLHIAVEAVRHYAQGQLIDRPL